MLIGNIKIYESIKLTVKVNIHLNSKYSKIVMVVGK